MVDGPRAVASISGRSGPQPSGRRRADGGTASGPAHHSSGPRCDAGAAHGPRWPWLGAVAAPTSAPGARSAPAGGAGTPAGTCRPRSYRCRVERRSRVPNPGGAPACQRSCPVLSDAPGGPAGVSRGPAVAVSGGRSGLRAGVRTTPAPGDAPPESVLAGRRPRCRGGSWRAVPEPPPVGTGPGPIRQPPGDVGHTPAGHAHPRGRRPAPSAAPLHLGDPDRPSPRQEAPAIEPFSVNSPRTARQAECGVRTPRETGPVTSARNSRSCHDEGPMPGRRCTARNSPDATGRSRHSLPPSQRSGGERRTGSATGTPRCGQRHGAGVRNADSRAADLHPRRTQERLRSLTNTPTARTTVTAASTAART